MILYPVPLRFGPRQIRVESALLRAYNSGTRAAPYQSITVADIGDVNVNLYDLQDTCRRIRDAYRKILAAGCTPLTMGESWWPPPVLQQRFYSLYHQSRSDFSLARLQVATTPSRTRSFRPWPRGEAPRPREERSFSTGINLDWCVLRHGPVGLVHVDAHADTSDLMLGEKIAHGTPFRRCVEEGLLDRERVLQIGLRGSSYSADAYEWSRAQVCSTGADRTWTGWTLLRKQASRQRSRF